jgi:hypothetical protein
VTIEEKLKELILKRYNSIREFTIAIDMPYTTMDSIFRRGIGNSSVSNIIKICKALGISADALADGEIKSFVNHTPRSVNDRIEINEILSDTKDILTHSDFVTLDGKMISENSIQSIIDAMDVGVEIAKRQKPYQKP